MAYLRDKMIELEEQKNYYHQLYDNLYNDFLQFKGILEEKD